MRKPSSCSSRTAGIDLLLDINMPKIDGWRAQRLNRFRWIEAMIAMISATRGRALSSAVTASALPTISAVRSTPSSCNASKTLTLYANQKRLMGAWSPAESIRTRRNSHVVSASSVASSRFATASAQHVLQVQTVTEMLLRKLTRKTDVYGRPRKDPPHHHTASALRHQRDQHPRNEPPDKAGALTPEGSTSSAPIPPSAVRTRGLTQCDQAALVKVAIEILPLAPRALGRRRIRTACSLNGSISAQTNHWQTYLTR